MHDIGKIVVPREIINKSTRLGCKIDIILLRFDYLKSLYKIDYLSGQISREEWLKTKAELKEMKRQIKKINKKSDDYIVSLMLFIFSIVFQSIILLGISGVILNI